LAAYSTTHSYEAIEKTAASKSIFANLIQVNCALLRPVVILLELGLYSCLNLRLWSLSFSVGLQCSKPRPLLTCLIAWHKRGVAKLLLTYFM